MSRIEQKVDEFPINDKLETLFSIDEIKYSKQEELISALELKSQFQKLKFSNENIFTSDDEEAIVVTISDDVDTIGVLQKKLLINMGIFHF